MPHGVLLFSLRLCIRTPRQTQTFIALALLMASLTAHAEFHVMIDPGHGGVDTGAVHEHLKEADLVLDLGVRLKRLLQKEQGIKITLSRESDELLPLPERVKKINDSKADLLVSLHANAAPVPQANGLELFFQNSVTADEDAQFLANLENQSATAAPEASAGGVTRRGDVLAIVEDLHRQSRLHGSLRFGQMLEEQWKKSAAKTPTIKQAPFRVVSQSTMPAVLVEVGFLTHPAEAKKLALSSYRDELTAKIRDAVIEFRSQLQRPTLGHKNLGQVEFQTAPR